MTEPLEPFDSPSRRAWDDLVRVARDLPSRVQQRLPHLSAADVAAIAALIDEALQESADGR